MRNSITIVAAAALALAAGLAPTPVQARDHHGNGTANAILGVAAGTALGLAISHRSTPRTVVVAPTYNGGYGQSGYGGGYNPGYNGGYSSGYRSGVTLPAIPGQVGYDPSMSNGQGYDQGYQANGYDQGYQQGGYGQGYAPAHVVVQHPRPAPNGVACAAWNGYAYVPVRRCGN